MHPLQGTPGKKEKGKKKKGGRKKRESCGKTVWSRTSPAACPGGQVKEGKDREKKEERSPQAGVTAYLAFDH